MQIKLKRTRTKPMTYEGTAAGFAIKFQYHDAGSHLRSWWDITLDGQWVHSSNTLKAGVKYLEIKLAGVQR